MGTRLRLHPRRAPLSQNPRATAPCAAPVRRRTWLSSQSPAAWPSCRRRSQRRCSTSPRRSQVSTRLRLPALNYPSRHPPAPERLARSARVHRVRQVLLKRSEIVLFKRVGVVAVLVAGGLVTTGSAAPGGGPISLAVPGRANANVSLVGDGAFVAAVWSAAAPDGVTDVFAAVSRDGGATFGAPVRVNSTPGDARVNGEQPPRVTLAVRSGARARGRRHLDVEELRPGRRLLTARSNDGGVPSVAPRWCPELTPLATEGGRRSAPIRRVVSTRCGSTIAGWPRPMRRRPQAAHQHGAHAEGGASMEKPDGVAMAQKSDLYFDTLGDAAPPRALTPGVCYCCKTAIAFGRGRRDLPGVASRLSGELPRHGVHGVARRRPHVRRSGSGQPGQLDARGLP